MNTPHYGKTACRQRKWIKKQYHKNHESSDKKKHPKYHVTSNNRPNAWRKEPTKHKIMQTQDKIVKSQSWRISRKSYRLSIQSKWKTKPVIRRVLYMCIHEQINNIIKTFQTMGKWSTQWSKYISKSNLGANPTTIKGVLPLQYKHNHCSI